jgi:ABC-type transport system involved in multi-copper enzyme maturation permease subunit
MNRIVTIAHVVWLEVLRRKDAYVLMILLASLLVTLVSLNVFGLGGVVGYVKDIGLLMAWLFAWILAIGISCRQLPQEEARGTVFALLAKPVTRLELVLGKWLGAWSVVAAANAAFYLLLAAIVAARGGRFDPLGLAQGYALHTAALAVVTALGLAFATRLNSDAAATLAGLVTGAAFLVVPHVPVFVAQQTGVRAGALLVLYNLLPHFELFDLRTRMVHNLGPVPLRVFGTVLLYGVALTALALLAAWLAYRNKRFSRGTLSGY